MATEIYKYRIWCDTDSKYVETWAEEEPTVCPENNVHDIVSDKTVIIDTIETVFPVSDIDGIKIAVHPSYKPAGDKQTYAVWSGSGDDLGASPPGIGEGELLDFDFSGSPLPTSLSKDVKFASVYGKVWLHEGYLKFENGGHNDHICAFVIAEASLVQTSVDKILVIEDNWIKYAPPGSPETATHGWGGTPTLIPRTYSQDGDWDYDGITLTPNFTGTGEYKISDTERTVHKYVNKISCCGTSPYFSITSDETTELPAGYFIRVVCTNNSGSVWSAAVLMELYRERTYLP